MMPTARVVVVGGVNTDYLIRGPALPRPGEALRGTAFQEAPGGKGANQAIAAARLGARASFVARVGADSRGDAALQRLAHEHVDVRYVVRDPGAPTGVAVIQVGARGQKQTIALPGANRCVSIADVQAAADEIRQANVLLVQLEIPVSVVAAAIRMAAEAGVRIVLDPAPPAELPDDLLRLVDVIRPNSSEATFLTGIAVHDRMSARVAASALLDRGALAAIVEAGPEGNLMLWRDARDPDARDRHERWLPIIPVDSVDETGAGDAFAAAIAVMLADGHSLAEAAPFASAAAALKTTTLGAQAGLPERAGVIALLERTGMRDAAQRYAPRMRGVRVERTAP